jgi:hypothetical protein
MSPRLQRLEELIRPLAEKRLERGVRSLSDAERARYVTDETEAKLELLSTLSNEQLIWVSHGKPLSLVLSQ